MAIVVTSFCSVCKTGYSWPPGDGGLVLSGAGWQRLFDGRIICLKCRIKKVQAKAGKKAKKGPATRIVVSAKAKGI